MSSLLYRDGFSFFSLRAVLNRLNCTRLLKVDRRCISFHFYPTKKARLAIVSVVMIVLITAICGRCCFASSKNYTRGKLYFYFLKQYYVACIFACTFICDADSDFKICNLIRVLNVNSEVNGHLV